MVVSFSYHWRADGHSAVVDFDDRIVVDVILHFGRQVVLDALQPKS